ncbi:hypothetical protein OK016_21825 [Vibrio chagasii]|nr:hypothetical protein [Vibrio chagasii]
MVNVLVERRVQSLGYLTGNVPKQPASVDPELQQNRCASLSESAKATVLGALFVSLNANEHQVSLMVEVFRNDMFAQAKRSVTHCFDSKRHQSAFTPQEISVGLEAANARLNLLQKLRGTSSSRSSS